MFYVQYLKNSEEDVSLQYYSLVKYDETEIHLQLNFTDPLLVSSGFSPDSIDVHLSKYLFVPVYEAYVVDDDPERRLQSELEDKLMFKLTGILPP